ncbi:MAG: hypothetical protein K2X27_08985, partial [Candidatus Obscuribacterales bacterium]|nr:hypothetical protein [Candidatus Obscuribacterales bacterium]
MLGSAAAKSSTGSPQQSPWYKRLSIWLLFLVIAGAGIAAYLFFLPNQNKSDWKKNTVKVERGAVDVRII